MKRFRLVHSTATVIATAGVLLAVLPAAGAASRTMHGVVLAKSPARHTLAVALTTGVVQTVHARSVRVGTRVDVVARRLHDSTFQAVRISTAGRASTAHLRHTVVLRQTAGGLLVAAGGSRLTLRTSGRTLAGVGASRLQSGTMINATLSINSSAR